MRCKMICALSIWLALCSIGFSLRADINGDCRVDMLDLAILASEWMQEDEVCMANNYLKFDGSTGYITVPDNAALDVGTGDFSISVWIKTTDTSFNIYSKDKGTTYNNLYYGFIADNYYLLMKYIYPTVGGLYGSFQYQTAAPSLRDGNFHHVVVTKTSLGIKFYIDNEEKTSIQILKVANPNADNTNPLYIGAIEGPDDFFEGSLDDLRIYKSALTAPQVITLYNSGKGAKYVAGQLAVEPSAVWNIDEGSGTEIIDEIVPLTGTITGGVTWEEGGVPFELISPVLLCPMFVTDTWGF